MPRRNGQRREERRGLRDDDGRIDFILKVIRNHRGDTTATPPDSSPLATGPQSGRSRHK
jgi:hypothetical protein